jgi:hypothetical protein
MYVYTSTLRPTPTFAQIGLCVPMLDLECEGADDMVSELFKVLFETIWYVG